MPQAVPLIGKTAALADELNELFDQVASDGVVIATEIAVLDPLVDQVKTMATRADLAYQWGMAVLKGGIDGKRAKELEIEISRFEESVA